MNAPGGTQARALGNTPDPYTQVLSELQKNPASKIAVPHLSKLLGVKSTTLNARFRRQQTSIETVGRTSFIPLELALRLAQLHKYALLGWPTLEQASRLTGVKSATIKARCEKGRVEGYMDLTKRLRISPAALSNLRGRDASEYAKQPPPRLQRSLAHEEMVRPDARARSQRQTEAILLPMGLKASPLVSTRSTRPNPQPVASSKHEPQSPKPKFFGCLRYDPERPFSVSECRPGQGIKYGPYDGTIVQVINDPFSPKILARFPEHEHPLMREVMLVVDRGAK